MITNKLKINDLKTEFIVFRSPQLMCDLSGFPVNVGESMRAHIYKTPRRNKDRITYKILILTYKSYYNIAPTYLCALISRRESSVNNRSSPTYYATN